MHKLFAPIRVQLLADTEAGLRVVPTGGTHSGDCPRVVASVEKTAAWIGITLEPGKAGDFVSIMPPYGGLCMAQLECDETTVVTGKWANTEANGYFSCHAGAGEISTGLIVAHDMDEAIAPGKIVKAMIFTGRFVYDGGPYNG